MTRFGLSLVVALGVLGPLGCASADSNDEETDPVVGATSELSLSSVSRVRVVHASPDAPAVDVYVRGIPFPIRRNVRFGDTTSYVRFARGSYTIDLRAAPSSVHDPIAYSTGALAIPARTTITAIAEGLLGSSDPESKFRVAPLVEKFVAPKAGATAVRIVHASPDAPTVGVDVGNDDPSNPEIPSLARFGETGAAGIALPSGVALQIGVDAAGSRVTAFTTPELPAGEGVFVIATGLLGKLPRERNGFKLLAVGPKGTVGFIKQNPIVYALHASPDAPAVDVFAGPAKAIGNLAFGQLAAPVQVPPGDLSLDFFGAASSAARPAGAPVTAQKVGGLAAGERYLAIATGFLAPKGSEPAFQLLGVAEGFDLGSASAARVRAVHASPDAPPVDIGLARGNTITSVAVSNLAFGSATPAAGLELPAT